MADIDIKMEADGEASLQTVLNVEPPRSNIDYPTVRFNTDGASVGSYQTLINTLRSYLKSGDTSHDIPLLLKSSQITKNNMFLLVEFFYYDEETKKKISITIALSVINIYVIGYKSENRSFFFNEAPAASQNLLFDGTTKIPVDLSTRYDKLAVDRAKIPLGVGALKKAIGILHDFDGIVYKDPFKESLVVVIEMVAEATRFKFIQQYVEFHLLDAYLPKGDTISFENAWDPLLEQIQLSGPDGKFRTPVRVQNADYSFKDITTVAEVKADIAILLYKGNGEKFAEGEIGEVCVEGVVEE